MNKKKFEETQAKFKSLGEAMAQRFTTGSMLDLSNGSNSKDEYKVESYQETAASQIFLFFSFY